MKDRRYDQTIGIQTLTIHLYSGLFYSLFLLYIFLIWKNIVLINIHKLLVCKCIFQQLLHWCTLSLISWSRGSQHMHWNAHSFLILLQLLISRSSVVTVLELEIQLNQNRSLENTGSHIWYNMKYFLLFRFDPCWLLKSFLKCSGH